VLALAGLNEEATEEDLIDRFAEHGEIKNCVLNLDRRTGYVKGYALLEYATLEEAKKTISSFDGKDF
jgi:RNA-binding protein 8A